MTRNGQPAPAEITNAFRASRKALLGVALFSTAINLLGLTSSIYMLQVYDRVLPAHSVPTLVALSLLALLLFACYGLLDLVRTRILSGIGLLLERRLRARVLTLVLEMPLRSRDGGSLQPIRDLDTLRNFLSSAAPTALFDMPWMPLYLGLIYVMHPWLGLLATAGGLCLVGITAATEMKSRAPTRAATVSGSARQTFAEAGRRNAEVVRALGMEPQLGSLWSEHCEEHLGDQQRSADVTAFYGTITKVLRLALQSAVLGLGAYLVIYGQASGGVMIAASILTSRALAPIEIAIGNWRAFLAARQSAARLNALFAVTPATPKGMELPAPRACLAVDGLWVGAPGQQRAIVQGVTFALQAGAGLGVIGPSASGKSTLVRALVGAWSPLRGSIRLDGATLDQWPPDRLGPHIGYLPQDIELFNGTVAENISRFDPRAASAAIIAAAEQAGVHAMIVALPAGYDTRIGEGGAVLSAGQRQRLGLARALYGNPFLVVLDEPNSNLDAEGDAALTRAIGGVRARGGIAIVVAHRPSAITALDHVLVMSGGQMQAFGPKEEVIGGPSSPPRQTPPVSPQPPNNKRQLAVQTAPGK